MTANWVKAMLLLSVSAMLLACPAVLAERATSASALRLIEPSEATTAADRHAVNGEVANAFARARPVTSRVVGQDRNRPGDQLLSTKQDMLEHLRRLQRTPGALAEDPVIVRRAEAKTALDEAWAAYEQMSSAFQALTRNSDAGHQRNAANGAQIGVSTARNTVCCLGGIVICDR